VEVTFRSEVKRICRQHLRDFISDHFNEIKRRTARVLCLPGPEAVEIEEVYEHLGIAQENIVCLEHCRDSFNELKRRNLRVNLRKVTLTQFLASAPRERFDIVSLDFCGQLATHRGSLEQLRNILDDDAIVFTNFCGAREAVASKAQYIASQIDLKSIRSILSSVYALPNGPARRNSTAKSYEAEMDSIARSIRALMAAPIGKLRAKSIHTSAGAALTNAHPHLLRMLFRERNRNGEMSKQAEKRTNILLRGLRRKPLSPLRDFLRQFLRMRAVDEVAMLGYFFEPLSRSLQIQLSRIVRRIYRNAGSRPALPVENASAILLLSLDIWLSRPFDIVASQSFHYVSNRATPMYADIFKLRRDSGLDYLGGYCRPNATTVAELLAPLKEISPQQLVLLLQALSKWPAQRKFKEIVPKRVSIGRERDLNPKKTNVTADSPLLKTRALPLAGVTRALSSKDIARRVGARKMQVAAWKAHLTRGTYLPESTEALERMVARAYTAGRYAEALPASARILSRQPRSVYHLHLHAAILSHLGEAAAALTFVHRALEIEPKRLDIQRDQAHLLHSEGRHCAALRVYQRMLAELVRDRGRTNTQRRSLTASLRSMIGAVLLELRRPTEARLQFASALQTIPSDFDARHGLAVALAYEGSLESARKHFDRLVKSHPKHVLIRLQRAFLLIETRQVDAALTDLKAAEKLDPDEPQTHRLLTQGYLASEHYAQALDASLNFIRLGEPSAAGLIDLALAYIYLARFEEALEVIEQALKRYPASLELKSIRATVLLLIDRPHAALHDFDQLVSLAPRAAGLRLGRAESLLELERLEEARLAFEQVLRIEAANPLALTGLARVWAKQDAPRKALVILDGLALCADEPPAVQLIRAQLWLELDQPARALPVVNRMLKTNPDDICALATKGDVLSLLGHHRAGLLLVDRSLSREPDNSSLHHCRGRILLRMKRPAAAKKAFYIGLRLRFQQFDSPRAQLARVEGSAEP
jgi:tetratricopeptide (TPR) repeat protein